jgi:hypothetical protein
MSLHDICREIAELITGHDVATFTLDEVEINGDTAEIKATVTVNTADWNEIPWEASAA